jgi:hypothetical protein
MDKDKSMDFNNSRANNIKKPATCNSMDASNIMDKTKIMDASKSYANNKEETPATAGYQQQHGLGQDHRLLTAWTSCSNRGIRSRTPATKRRRKNGDVGIKVFKL